MTSTEIAAGTMPRWTVHICSTTEDQRAFEHALRTWLLTNGYRLTEPDGLPLLSRLEIVRTADLCLVLLGPTFGTCDSLSSFSTAELEAAVAADAHPGKLLVFAQAGVDGPTSPEQREFIDRLRNFAGGTFQSTCQTPDELIRQVQSALSVWQPPRPREQVRAAEPPPGALMISSTGDLVDERNLVHEMLDQEGYPVIDYLRAASETIAPIERITTWASGCDALLLILGSRYGYISPVDGLGITELEFVTTLRAGRPVLAFLHADAETSPDADERQFAERVRTLVPPRQVFSFADLDSLRTYLRDALQLLRAGVVRPCAVEMPPASAQRWYRRQIRRWLGRLPHLTRLEGMPLETMFVSLIRTNDEAVKKQAGDYQVLSSFVDHQQILQRDALTADDALRSYPRLVIRGVPGAGKSVTLHWYALTAPEDVTPVLLRLDAYAQMRASGQITNLLAAAAREEQRLVLAPGADQSAWRAALEAGRGLLLLDGLDQVPLDQKRLVAADIAVLARQLPKTSRIVVATRDTASAGGLAGVFTICDILPPNPEQARQLLLQILSIPHAATPTDRDQIERRAAVALTFATRRDMTQWVSTPLMLSLLAVLADAVASEDQPLLKSQAEILRRVLRLLLGRWKTLNQQRSFWHLIEKERLLLGLAREGTLKGHEERVTLGQIETLWSEAPSSLRQTPVDELIHELCEGDGLLVRQGDGEFTFLHTMFPAYLAAKLVAVMPPLVRQEQVGRRRLSARWDETALLLVSELDRANRPHDGDAVVETLRLADRQPISEHGVADPLHVALARAARCQGSRADKRATSAVAARVAADLIHVWRAWRNQPIPDPVKIRTFGALADLGPALAPMLDDLIAMVEAGGDAGTKSAALRALGALASSGVARAVETLNRYNAKAVIGELVPISRMSVDVLRQQMRDPNRMLRRAAASQLNRLGAAAVAALPELRQALWDDQETVRMATVLTLGAIGPAAAPAAQDLLRLLETLNARPSNGPTLGLFILPALGEMGPAAIAVSDALLSRALSPEGDRADGVGLRQALSLIGLTAEGRAVFMRALDDASDAKRRARAYQLVPALASHLALDWRQVLAKGLEPAEEGQPFYPAGEVVRELPPTDVAAAVAALRGLLNSPSWQDRLRALGMLRAIGPDAAPALPELRAILQGKDGALQDTAIQVVGGIGPAAATLVELLRPKLHDPIAAQRTAVASALERIGPGAAPAVSDLRTMLHYEDSQSRRYAANALAAIGFAAAPAVGELQELLRDADVPTRMGAAMALRAIGPAAAPAVGDLYQMLGDPDRDVSVAAGLALMTLLPSIEDAAYVPIPAGE